jgi:NADPH-dependent 2,4-dienoyl-CoA reductase/sulfur reductase-like enzyme/nitrite reductase/ring-hydroxylating ferredoxin subunit
MASEKKPPEGPDFSAGVAVSAIPDGGMLAGKVGNEGVVLARQGEEIFALSAKCTHYGGNLGHGLFADGTIRCPLHHARFDVRTGEAVGAPAIDPVGCWRIERDGDRVVVREKRAAAARAKKADSRRFVIIGGGAAGLAAAERLRRNGFEGEITFVSAENDLPVDRPNLSKDYLAGKAPDEWVFLKPASFYEKNRITALIGVEAVAIETEKRTVRLSDGRSLPFDALLIATGAEPVRLAVPGAELPHVHTLRSFADSRAISEAAKTARHAVVIGASFIGLEVAASLVERGLKVQVVARSARPLEKVLGRDLGDFIRAEHEAHGVVFHLGRKPADIAPGRLTMDDGRVLDADIVVAGIGVRPRTGLAEAAGLKVDDGILVDETMATSAPGIFAAGDVARYPDPYAGGTTRIEHWAVAQNLGGIAALNMLGVRAAFTQPPFFWSQHYDLRITYAGHATEWGQTLVDGAIAKHSALLRYVRGGRTMAVAGIGRDLDSLRAEFEMERELADQAR